MKKFKKIMSVIILILVSLILFHTLNKYYPKNIVQRTINGAVIVLSPVLISLVLMYLVNPFTDRLIKKYKWNKTLAIITTMILLFLVLAGLIFFVSFFIVNQGKHLINNLLDPTFIANVEAWFAKHNLNIIFDAISDFIESFQIKDILGPATSIITITLQILTTIILVPIFLWHFLNHKDLIGEKVEENIPNNWKKHLIPIAIESNEVVVSYFKSKVISIILLFIMFMFVYLGLGLPIGYVILFSILISLLDLIPYLGPTTALLVPIIYIFSTKGVNLFYNPNWHINAIAANIILLLINFAIQLIQGNIIVPKLAGKEMKINPGLILVFMLFFGSILGLWGVVLSIPLGGIIIVIWRYLKNNGILEDKNKLQEDKNEQI